MSKEKMEQLSKSLRIIANLIERKPDFLNELEKWLYEYDKSDKSTGANRSERKEYLNIFELYSKGGRGALLNELKSLSDAALREIIMKNNLDPSKLSHKWKNRENLIELILDRTAGRANRGRVFLDYGIKENQGKSEDEPRSGQLR
jgi:hypothetical protein